MIIAGYVLAVFMGMTLGLIGAGGSILTVPILVYFLEVPAVTATGYSLLFVGATALIGGIRYWRKNQVDTKTTIIFSVPSILAVYATRRWLVPTIPETLFTVGSFTLTKDLFVMLFFAILMLIAAVLMIRSGSLRAKQEHEPAHHYLLIILEGAIVGVFTGIIGAGGGFLIIPALVLLAGLEMKVAVGSSLCIIACKSLLGFLGDLQTGIELNGNLILIFLLCTFSGMVAGTAMAKQFDGAKLKKAFGWFTLLVALAVIVKEF